MFWPTGLDSDIAAMRERAREAERKEEQDAEKALARCTHDFPSAFGVSATDGDSCAVCLDPLDDESLQLSKLPCGHLLHRVCLEDWWKYKKGHNFHLLCPICKFNPLSELETDACGYPNTAMTMAVVGSAAGSASGLDPPTIHTTTITAAPATARTIASDVLDSQSL
mmetsp:Transcript_42982/g.99615  ORF Transcript_42982/g.99615 Transcript_42982/m.99615 type:complete len:167 (+) Transcript_42982:699-1199(+)